jgi:hypothetical protein
MISSQNDLCPICGSKLGNARARNVDHCHKTGKVRMVICGMCNRGLGSFRDSVALLESAIVYLKKFQ